MKLTEKQRQRIARHLRDMSAKLTNMPSKTRERVLERMKERIRGKLERRADGVPSDSVVEEVLQDCTLPPQLLKELGVFG